MVQFNLLPDVKINYIKAKRFNSILNAIDDVNNHENYSSEEYRRMSDGE